MNTTIAQPNEDGLCSADLAASCAAQSCCSTTTENDSQVAAPVTADYNCSLPGLAGVFQPGQYAGVQVNYLSFVTDTSSPNLPIRATEFEACTGATIVFSEAANIWEDPIRE